MLRVGCALVYEWWRHAPPCVTQARVQGLHDSLWAAADVGDFDAVQKMIVDGADVNEKSTLCYVSLDAALSDVG